MEQSYTQLNHANLETRFLRLRYKPQDASGTMQFDLTVASLSNPPRYSALSYCWGPEGDRLPISINDREVLVRKNLAEALFNCDLQEHDRIWVDALCINQGDLHEKNYQIKLMGHIYSRARQTRVWLGPAHPFTRYTGTLLRRCNQILDARPAEAMNEPLHDASNQFHYILHQALRDHRFAPKAMRGLEDLLSRPYWARIWIIQEVAKAAKVDLYCGKHRLDFRILLYAANVSTQSVPQRSIALIRTIAQFRAQEQIQIGGNSRMTLSQALIETRHSLATDPRDKVYALLGLTSDGNDLVPTPTYTQAVPEMFSNLTVALIRSRLTTNTILLTRYAPLQDEFQGALFAVNWSDLSHIPPWVASRASPAIADAGSWHLTARRSILSTNARLITRMKSLAGSHAPRPSKTDNMDTRERNAQEVLEHVTTDLLRLLAPHVSITVPTKDMRDALSRMIRDAQSGISKFTGFYDLHRVRLTLLALGSLEIDHYDIDHFAREHNYNCEHRPGGTLYNTQAFRVWETVLYGLDGPPESRLRFALFGSGSGRIGLVHPEARLRDRIYQIDQCQLPVVLREHSPDQFILVGEACLARHTDGTWFSGKRMTKSRRISKDALEHIDVFLGAPAMGET